MGTVALNGVVQNNAESINGWNAGGVDAELSYQGSGSIGIKAGSGVTALVHTGTSRNFAVAGANEGDHIIVLLNSLTAGKLNTKANGGLRLRFGTSATVYGDKFVDGSDTKSPTTAFLPYIANPAADFDEVAGGLSLTGNPAQLSGAVTFGGVFNATSGIMGNFNNALVDQITIGKGLELTGTAGTMQDFIDADEGTIGNRYGFLTTKEGSIFTQGKLYLGTASTSLQFDDLDRSITFQNAPVASDFYEVVVDNAASNITLNSFFIKSAGAAQAALTHLAGTLLIRNGTIDSFRSFLLQSSCTIEDQKISNSGQITLNSATLTRCSIVASTASSAIVVTSPAELAGLSDMSFQNSSGHSIEITAAGAYNLTGFSFSGGGADETVTADIYNNSGGHIDISGVSPTVRNGAGSTTAIVSPPVTLTLTGIVSGSRVSIIRASDRTILTETLNSGSSFAYGYDYGGDVDVWIRILTFANPWYEIDYTLSGTDASIPINQTNDRVSKNP